MASTATGVLAIELSARQFICPCALPWGRSLAWPALPAWAQERVWRWPWVHSVWEHSHVWAQRLVLELVPWPALVQTPLPVSVRTSLPVLGLRPFRVLVLLPASAQEPVWRWPWARSLSERFHAWARRLVLACCGSPWGRALGPFPLARSLWVRFPSGACWPGAHFRYELCSPWARWYAASL